MRFLLKHLRAFAIGFFTLVVVPVLTTVVIDYLKERDQYHPGALLDPLLSFVHAVGANPWVRGAALVLTGLLVGVWLDALRRRKEKLDLQVQSDLIDAQLPVEERRATLKLRREEAEKMLASKTNCFEIDYKTALDRIAGLKEKITTNESEAAEKLRVQLEVEQTDRISAEKRAADKEKEWGYEHRFGPRILQPIPPEFTTADLGYFGTDVTALLPYAMNAGGGARKLLVQAQQDMHTSGSTNPSNYWLSLVIEESHLRPAGHAIERFDAEAKAGVDSREALVVFYRHYHDMRAWLGRAAACLGKEVTALDGYRNWRIDDKHFDEQLREKLERPQFDFVKLGIQRVNAKWSYPFILPD